MASSLWHSMVYWAFVAKWLVSLTSSHWPLSRVDFLISCWDCEEPSSWFTLLIHEFCPRMYLWGCLKPFKLHSHHMTFILPHMWLNIKETRNLVLNKHSFNVLSNELNLVKHAQENRYWTQSAICQITLTGLH